MNDKNWYASKTVWANALAIIATIAGALGMDFGLTPEVQAEIAVAGIAVAIEHPADVIPLAEDAASRARRVTGFHRDDAPLQIRHFDPYTTSIRFIARGDEPDYDLVVSFLEMGWIDMSGLDDEIRKLLPRFSFDTIQQDPAEFRRKFKGLTQIWRAKSGMASDGSTVGTVKV